MYKGNNAFEAIVRRFVTPCSSSSGECLPVLGVEELAKKKGVKMAQIAVA